MITQDKARVFGLMLLIVLGIQIHVSSAYGANFTSSEIDTLLHENEVMRSEIARLQNLIKSTKEVMRTDAKMPTSPDSPDECAPGKHHHNESSHVSGHLLYSRQHGRRLEEEELEPWQIKIKMYACMVAISAIIAISIGFEIGRDILEERTKEAMKPILRNVFAELTILGFIGLIMFFTTKYGKPSLDNLVGNETTGWFKSECFMRECKLICPENPLIEETETVHMVLFLVMMIFLASVVLLVKISDKKTKHWRYLEDVALTTPLLKLKHDASKLYDEYRAGTWWNRFWTLKHKMKVADEKLRYAALREGFIYTCNKNVPDPKSEHRLSTDFDFHEYVSHELNGLLIEMAEIPPANWLYLWIIFMIFLAVDLIDETFEFNGMLVVYCSIGAAYVGAFVMLLIRNKIQNVESNLIHHEHVLDEKITRGVSRMSVNVGDEESKGYTPLLSDDDHTHDIMHHTRDPLENNHHPTYKYWADGTLREKPTVSCRCCFRNKKVDEDESEEDDEGYHEALFWGGEEGVEILEAFVRSQLVCLSIYIGCMALPLSASIMKYFNPEHSEDTEDTATNYLGPLLLYTFAFIPVILTYYEVEHVLPNLSLVTSVEEMVNNKGVLRTLRLMKSKGAMQALHNISCFMHGVDRLAVESKQKALEVQIFTTLTPQQKKALMDDAEVTTFAMGQDIVQQGKNNTFLYIITDGSCNVVVDDKTVAEMGLGREFGEISLLSGATCKATVRAKERTTCLKLDLKAYKKHLEGRGQGNATKRRTSMIAFMNSKPGATPPTVATLESVDEDVEEESAHQPPPPPPPPPQDQDHLSVSRDLVAKPSSPRKQKQLRQKSSSAFLAKKNKGRLKSALQYYRRVALSKIFRCIDTDGGGEVNQEELETFLGKMFPGEGDMYETQLKLMIEGLDEDGDGDVTEAEFLKMMVPIVEQEEESVEMEVVAKRMFEILDDDDSGFITTSEFKETLEKMGVSMSYEEVRELFHEYDDNLDGVMDEEEFITMMTHQL